MTTTRLPSILFLSVLFAACGGGDGAAKGGPAAPTEPTEAALKQARVVFDSVCFTCHGATGHGDGPGAGPLNPKPRSFADPAWQDSVTDDHIRKTIVYGGAAVGKTATMPAHPQYKGQTDLLLGLTKIVRGFRAAK